MTEKERRAWEAVRGRVLDLVSCSARSLRPRLRQTAKAIEDLLAEEPEAEPEPLNASPPDDLPCYVPGSVWILRKEGPVSCEAKGYQPDDYDRDNSRYIYTVPEVKP